MMEFEFDKEIDSLLRQTVRNGEFAPAIPKAHVDADEISLFAENVLPPKAHVRVTKHLADCTKCRNILANVILLDSDASSEIVHAKESEVAALAPQVPWYKSLFAFPQLAYTMGALVVLLAGMIGFIALQSVNQSQNSSVAQIEKTSESSTGTSENNADESVTFENYSANMNSNTMSANSNMAMSADTTGKSSVPPSSASNPTVPAPIISGKNLAAAESDTPKEIVTTSADTAKKEESPAKPASSENRYSADGAAGRAASLQNAPTQNSVVQNQTNISPDSRNVQSRKIEELPLNSRSTQSLSITAAPESAREREDRDETQKSRKMSKSKPAEDKKDSAEKIVGGKTFKRADGVWYDTAYNQQKTVNVRRNSDDYKKLDSGLRSIADNLGGTVVIVWKNKAYRIQ